LRSCGSGQHRLQQQGVHLFAAGCMELRSSQKSPRQYVTLKAESLPLWSLPVSSWWSGGPATEAVGCQA
jgi:hypothetical protein